MEDVGMEVRKYFRSDFLNGVQWLVAMQGTEEEKLV